ncbi:hypothetical protein WA026_023510 [Henosepilachna vigintioctopunctata]|uniref:Uncharacterized protein n=1 Tax=Henosepilachna vigintioctopunctata TaxID=420089 RepID=A0AAW1UEY5_9CUCU
MMFFELNCPNFTNTKLCSSTCAPNVLSDKFSCHEVCFWILNEYVKTKLDFAQKPRSTTNTKSTKNEIGKNNDPAYFPKRESHMAKAFNKENFDVYLPPENLESCMNIG